MGAVLWRLRRRLLGHPIDLTATPTGALADGLKLTAGAWEIDKNPLKELPGWAKMAYKSHFSLSVALFEAP